VPVNDAPTRPLGTLGPGTINGWADALTDMSEHVPDLQYPWSLQVLSKMRLDPTLASIIQAYVRPITAAPWAVDPSGADEGHARAVADSLGLPLVGEKQPPGDARRRGVQWRTHIQLAASGMLTWGHMPFAPWYRVESGRAVLAGLPERMPQSLTGMDINESTGDLTGIRQMPFTHGDSVADEVKIPARDLVFYCHDREGSAWFGRPMLRPAYAPWLLKQDTLRVHATTLRRFGAGTPTVQTQPGFTPTAAEHAAAQAVAAGLRVGESAGAALGPGFLLRILGIEGSIPDALPFLRYLDEQMARMSLASVMDLGATPNGSRALGAEFGDLLTLALNGVGQLMASTATKLAVDMTDYNVGADAPSPAIVVGDVGSNPAEMATAIADLVSKGGLTMDAGLEGFVRDGLRLPPKPVDITTEPTDQASIDALLNDPAADDRLTASAHVHATAGDVPLDARYRPLTEVEAKAGLDPATIDDLTDTATADAVTAWGPVQAAWVAEAMTAVTAAVEAGDLTGLATWVPDRAAAQAVILTAMEAGAAAGVTTARQELTAQGVTPPPAEPDGAALEAAAVALAVVLAGGFAASTLRSAGRFFRPGTPPRDVAVAVVSDLEALSGAYVEGQLGGAVQTGLTEGRTAVQAAAPAVSVTWVHSAVRDRSTCLACSANDGHLYPSLVQARTDFPMGGYALCQGRERCRCVIFMRAGV
jgi:hypothetical protein